MVACALLPAIAAETACLSRELACQGGYSCNDDPDCRPGCDPAVPPGLYCVNNLCVECRDDRDCDGNGRCLNFRCTDDWQLAFDFDGDGRTDRLDLYHCVGGRCGIQVWLSQNRERLNAPFEMLTECFLPSVPDLSQPECFAIQDANGDGVVDLLYHASLDAIREDGPRYGVEGTHIAVSFRGGEVTAWNLGAAPKESSVHPRSDPRPPPRHRSSGQDG